MHGNEIGADFKLNPITIAGDNRYRDRYMGLLWKIPNAIRFICVCPGGVGIRTADDQVGH